MARRNIILGEAGETWTNNTPYVQYQFFCNWQNTCGVCASYDSAVGPIWPIPIHRGCRCHQSPIAVGAKGRPFTNFLETARNLTDVQRQALVGASNWLLIEAGLVAWTDVVTASRVRTLREVVARARFARKQLTDAGVRGDVADRALGSLDTPAAEIAAAHRRALVEKIEAAGVPTNEAIRAAAAKLAERVTTGPRPSSATASEPMTPEELPQAFDFAVALRAGLSRPRVSAIAENLGRALATTFALAELRRRAAKAKAEQGRRD